MKTHTDTPETRALWHETLDWCQKRDETHDPYHAQLANLAEKLERERDEAREELSEAKKDYLSLATRLDGHDATECLANLIRIIEQRDGLMGALEWYGEQARLCRLIHGEGDAGRNALSSDGGKKAADALAMAKGGVYE